MTIELITPKTHKILLDIFNKYPKLTLQNKGYEYINRYELTEEETNKLAEVTNILQKHIKDFRKFNNFRLNKNNEIEIRIQYAWSEHFTGVGYLLLNELLNGFNN